ncbi:hypothetical protein [Mesorhizobium sp. B1-1-8]|uniref:hypothetical protein n=1 Tax=Mesorhizobium sp. B1-1-8 TaxID=2589976 RepID=UPI00112CEE06|nr:hypothetical protein [Mesorhizobium sp. B1-1-8]UCI10494.1 hypothetical protein FJ974_29765 [Mesorhizobium sp. B1-1-8]
MIHFLMLGGLRRPELNWRLVDHLEAILQPPRLLPPVSRQETARAERLKLVTPHHRIGKTFAVGGEEEGVPTAARRCSPLERSPLQNRSRTGSSRNHGRRYAIRCVKWFPHRGAQDIAESIVRPGGGLRANFRTAQECLTEKDQCSGDRYWSRRPFARQCHLVKPILSFSGYSIRDFGLAIVASASATIAKNWAPGETVAARASIHISVM